MELEAATRDLTLYGVVHVAWLGAPRAGLLASSAESMELQLRYGTTPAAGFASVPMECVDAEAGDQNRVMGL